MTRCLKFLFMEGGLVRFLVGGGTATLMHWGTMAALIRTGFDASLATTLGASLGAALNYLLQYHFTHGGRSRHRHAIPAYLGVVALTLTANAGLFGLLYTGMGLTVAFAQGVTTLLITFMNFLLYREVVFR